MIDVEKINWKIMKKISELHCKQLSLCLKPNEWKQVNTHFQSSTCRSRSEYLRKVILAKPVTVNYRNQSVDELLSESIQLKNELTTIGSNFSQAVKLLHGITGTDEARDWALFNEAATQTLFNKIEEIRQQMIQNYQLCSRI